MIIDWSGTRDDKRCFKVMEGDDVLYEGFEIELKNVSGACSSFDGRGVLKLERVHLYHQGNNAVIEGATNGNEDT